MTGAAEVRNDAIEAVEPVAADVRRPEVALRVQRASTRDDEQVTARLHTDALQGLFVRFGPGFLRAYHASFRRSPHAVSFVVLGPDGIVGFLVGTIDNEAHYRWLARRALPLLGLRAIAALVRRPRVALETVRTRSRRYLPALVRRLRPRRGPAHTRGPSAGDTSSPERPAAPAPTTTAHRVGVLTHVAVVPAARGTGAGRRLVHAYEAALREAGVDEARLITAPGGGAPAFYRRLGWTGAGIRTGADGAEVEEFVRTW